MKEEERIIAGKKYIFAEVDRDPRIPWKDQIESMEDDYEDFDWSSVSGGKIRFFYTRKKDGVA